MVVLCDSEGPESFPVQANLVPALGCFTPHLMLPFSLSVGCAARLWLPGGVDDWYLRLGGRPGSAVEARNEL